MFPPRKSSCKNSMVNKLLCKRYVLIELRISLQDASCWKNKEVGKTFDGAMEEVDLVQNDNIYDCHPVFPAFVPKSFDG